MKTVSLFILLIYWSIIISAPVISKDLKNEKFKHFTIPLKKPLIKPYSFKASIKYSEQVGKYLQLLPSKGEIKY